MNPWIALIIGLFIGWLIELLIDIFYWRKRRLCPEDEALHLKASLEQAQTDNRSLQLSLDENNGRMGQLETDLTTRDARITGLLENMAECDGRVAALTADLETRLGEIDGLNGRVGDLEAALAARDTELATLRAELKAKNAELGQIHADLGDIEALNSQVGDLEKKLAVCNASLLEMHTNLGSDFKGAQGLSMVWGMNSAASDLLANRGIYTYNQLADTQVEEVNNAIELSGEYYPGKDNVEIHGSWVEQSLLAGAGDWDGLNAYQQKRFDLINFRDDLKKIWGIGPKVEQVMNDNGIYLFAQMASVPPDRITEILRRAGSRFSMSTGKLHDTWPEQARLADQGDWDAFQALQDSLDWSRLQGE